MEPEKPPAPLVAVDGDALMHRAYHATPAATGVDGHPVNALSTFVGMLAGLWDAYAPRALAVALDCRTPGYRNALWPPYQAQRPPFDREIVWQLDALPALLAAFGIAVAKEAPHEADDMLAAWATAEDAAGGRCLVVTHDRDAYQLVTDHVLVVRPVKGVREVEVVDRAGVVARYGVLPEQVPDLIALRGDPSDNLPGAVGIGEKTAAALLLAHGDLEGVIAAADGMAGRRRGSLVDAAESLRAFRRIATMDRDAPAPRPADHVPDWAGGAEACRALGIRGAADRLARRA